MPRNTSSVSSAVMSVLSISASMLPVCPPCKKRTEVSDSVARDVVSVLDPAPGGAGIPAPWLNADVTRSEVEAKKAEMR